MKVLPSECDCKVCSNMCQNPCCGTPDDFEALIKAGYASRLMYDDWAGDIYLLKPAIKGYEGKLAPWLPGSKEGCTFWKDGKCELHATGLKPTQGKLAHHSNKDEEHQEIEELIRASWRDGKGQKIINKFKRLCKPKKINEKENSSVLGLLKFLKNQIKELHDLS